jgi:peptidase E
MSDYILLSGVSRETGFSEPAARVLKRSIWDMGRILFIASDPENHAKTDENTKDIMAWFQRLGIEFKAWEILDSRMPDGEQQRAIPRASCVFLCGGDTLAQINYLKAQNLLEPLRRFNGLVIGLSAGSINMGKRSIVLVNPYREHTWVYEGIGLVDITVIPHFDPGREAFYRTEALPLTYESPIYGMCDDGVIAVRNGDTVHGGTIFAMEQGTIRQLRDEESI